MKRFRIFILIIICMAAHHISRCQFKYIVRLKDKQNATFSFSNPVTFLSRRAVLRRQRCNIPIDSADLPVNLSYVNDMQLISGVTCLSKSKWLNAILIACRDTAVLQSIRQLPFVASTQPVAGSRQTIRKPKDIIHYIKENSNNGTAARLNYGNSFGQLHIHNGEYLHNKGFTGGNIQIAVLDAGFYHYKSISAFDSLTGNGQVLGEKDFVEFDDSVNEDDAHGELCLSIMAANVPGTMIGSAPKAAYWLLRTEDQSAEKPVEEFNWVAGAEYADSCGADIISSSLGYNKFDNNLQNHSYKDFYNNSTIISQGAAMAVRKGMIVTTSAGNEGNNAWKYIVFPADADSVCAVGAVNTSGRISFYSSYGYPGKVKPNIVSVGAATVVYNDSGVGTGSGTSYSNPNIAGLIACLWQAFPAYNNMTILNAVYQSADRYNNPDNRYGYGIPDMKAAYKILKKQQNKELYGNNWLFVQPDTFTNKIETKFIARKDGNTLLKLIDANGKLIDSLSLQTEADEVYNTAFNNLDVLPPGLYYIQYKDDSADQKIAVFKTENYSTGTSWLKAYPVPFTNTLNIAFTARETAHIVLRLTNINGKVIQARQADVVEGSYYTFIFNNALSVSAGNYFVEYAGDKLHTTVKVVKSS